MDNNHQACLDVAYRYLGYRARSEQEMRLYLQRRCFNDKEVDKVIAELKRSGLIDDADFAKLWTERRQSFNPRGRAMLRLELRRKGVDADIVSQAIEDVDDSLCAYDAARRKVRHLSTSDQSQFQRKLFNFLRQRGFGYGICQNTVDRLWQEVMGEKDNV
ncbi:MAG: regulatory protein RecX [Chloroflexota bacterium]|nr:regulatory protein RecX [Chloroflexota bacterium]